MSDIDLVVGGASQITLVVDQGVIGPTGPAGAGTDIPVSNAGTQITSGLTSLNITGPSYRSYRADW